MSDQFGPVAAQPLAESQNNNGPQAVQIQDEEYEDDFNNQAEVVSQKDDQEDQNNNQQLQQSQNQSKNNPSTAQIARQQSAVKEENNSTLQQQPNAAQIARQQSTVKVENTSQQQPNTTSIARQQSSVKVENTSTIKQQPNTAQIARQQSSVKVENNSALQKQASTIKVQKQKSTVQQKQREDDDDDQIEQAVPKSKPVQDNKNQLASSNLQQSNDQAKSRNENPQPKKPTLLKVAQEQQDKPKPAIAAVQNRSDVKQEKPKSKPKSKSKSGNNKEPDYEILLYQKDNKKIYWTNQTDIHPDNGVDIGFRIGDNMKYHMPEIKTDNAGYVVKLFYNLAKQFFTKEDNLYLCFPRGGQKGKLQFARNLFYVMGFDYLENNVDIFEASGAVTICLQETKLYNEKFAESLDEFTNCQMINLYKVDGFERIQDRDTIDIILQIIKLKTKQKEFPKITLADVNEKEVDKVLKDYTKMNKAISRS